MGEVQPSSAPLGFIDGSLFVIFCLLEFFVELGQFGIQFADDLLHFVQFDGGYFQLFLGFLELLSQGSDFLDHIPELNNVDDP